MKGTPHEWRKATVAGFSAQINGLVKQRDSLSAEIDNLTALRDANAKVKLKKLWTKKVDQTAPTKAKTVSGAKATKGWQRDFLLKHLPKVRKAHPEMLKTDAARKLVTIAEKAGYKTTAGSVMQGIRTYGGWK